MAKITSRTSLNVGTEIVLDTTNKTVQLVATGNLVAKDGVTVQAVYSKLVDLWNTSTYNDYDFPMYAKDALSGQFTIGYNGVTYNGWSWKDANTRKYLRDGGWSEYDSSGVLQKQYVGIVSLGTLASSGIQTYYQLTNGGSAADFSYTDVPNEGIKVYDLGASLDSRTYFKAYARAQGYTYDESDLTDTGLTATGAFKVNVLLANASDPNITDNDATVTSTAPYTGITATWLVGNNFDTTNTSPYAVDDVVRDGAGRWYICTGAGTADATDYADLGAMAGAGTATFTSYGGERLIDGSYYAFNIIVDGNAANKEKIYTKIQYLLRQNSDIDSGSGTHTGKITPLLMAFEGDTLVTTTGVYIDDTLSLDATSIIYTDVLGVERSIPFVANQSVTISGATAGSRIQIYDLTSSTELYNGTPTFPYTWTDSSPYVADREIRLRVAYVNGATAKEFIEANIGTATEADYALSYLVSQTNDFTYNQNAVDGSTVTGITIDDGTMLLELSESTESWAHIYAYEMYWLSTSTGIQDLGQSITSPDPANYLMDSTVLKIKNVSGSVTTLTGGWGRDPNTSDTMDIIDTSGDHLFANPPHVVAYATSGGSSAADVWSYSISGKTAAARLKSSEDNAELAAIK